MLNPVGEMVLFTLLAIICGMLIAVFWQLCEIKSELRSMRFRGENTSVFRATRLLKSENYAAQRWRDQQKEEEGQ